MKALAYKVAAFLCLAAFYCLAWGAGFLHTPPFVSPAELLEFTASIEFARLVAVDAGTTMAATIVCWVLGVTLGVLAGVVTATLGVYRPLPQAFLEFLRSVPSIVWIPLAISILGIGAKTVLGVATICVFFYVASEIAYSDTVFDKKRSRHLSRLGLSYVERIRTAHLYEVLTVATPTARVAITIGLIVIVIGEMLAGAQSGLGARLLTYQAGQRFEGMFAVFVLSGILGLACSVLGDVLERRLTPWIAK